MHPVNIHVKHRNSQGGLATAGTRWHTVGMSIERIRQARGLNQIELAEVAGLSQSAVSRAENHEEGTTLRTLMAIARALNVQIKDLFDDRSSAEQQIIDLFRQLPPERQKVWLEMSRMFSQGLPAPTE